MYFQKQPGWIFIYLNLNELVKEYDKVMYLSSGSISCPVGTRGHYTCLRCKLQSLSGSIYLDLQIQFCIQSLCFLKVICLLFLCLTI